MTDPRDLDKLYAGMRTARGLIKQSSVKNGGGLQYTEVLPGPLFRYSYTRAWFDFFVRFMSTTYFHACGTCKMIPIISNTTESRSNKTLVVSDGCTVTTTTTAAVCRKSDEVPTEGVCVEENNGVVDTEFRVLGVSGLRVVDASVIPAIPSSPTHALCMVLGEACGQLLNSNN